MVKWVIMKNGGFTLVELLVVIGVVSLLTAILVPSLQNSRQGAKAILCSSNIKQLTYGLIVHDTDKGAFPHALDGTRLDPPPGGFPGDFAYDRPGWWWFNHIVHYSRKDSRRASIIWCPSRRLKAPGLEGNVLCGNYGVNQSICRRSSGSARHREHGFVGAPLSATYISHPGQTLLVVDCGYSMISWCHAADSPGVALGPGREDTASYVPGLRINEHRQICEGLKHDALDGRHPNKTVNVGFVDGHAKQVKADDLFVEKAEDGYRNQSPLWVPK